MDLPSDIITKEEHDLPCLDSNDNYSSFNLHVKCETISNYDEVKWCTERKPLFDTENVEPTSFDALMEYKEQKCSLCYIFYNNSYALFKHYLTHLTVNVQRLELYQCNDCSKYHFSKENLIHHIKRLHKPTTVSKYNQNYYINEKEKAFLKLKSLHRCNICRIKLNYKTWHPHMRKYHETDLKCVECKKKFKSTDTLRKHLIYCVRHEALKPSWRNHTVTDTNIICDHCSALFINKASYAKHYLHVHSNGVHTCTICKSTFKNKPYLQSHIRRVHYSDGKDHICKICKKKYRSPRKLKIHMRYMHQI